MTNSLVEYLITAILGGGFFKGIETLYRAVSDAREKKALSLNIGAKTPVEIESASVTTMAVALQSAQDRIEHLESERETDRSYYQARIAELTEQLHRVRNELREMEIKLSNLVADQRNPSQFKMEGYCDS